MEGVLKFTLKLFKVQHCIQTRLFQLPECLVIGQPFFKSGSRLNPFIYLHHNNFWFVKSQLWTVFYITLVVGSIVRENLYKSEIHSLENQLEIQKLQIDILNSRNQIL